MREGRGTGIWWRQIDSILYYDFTKSMRRRQSRCIERYERSHLEWEFIDQILPSRYLRIIYA